MCGHEPDLDIEIPNDVGYVHDASKRRVFIRADIQKSLRSGGINLLQASWQLCLAYWF